MQKYVSKFWDLHLKAIVFKHIDFVEQKQYCAELPTNINKYVQAMNTKTILKLDTIPLLHPKSSLPKKDTEDCNKRIFFLWEEANNNNKNNKANFKGHNKLSLEELGRYEKKNRASSVVNWFTILGLV